MDDVPAAPLDDDDGDGPAGLAAHVAEAAERGVRRRAGVVVGAVRAGRSAVAGRGDDGRGAPPTARTLFEIGSVTKVFTALLLADGVVRGQWRLDTPVAELLPDVRVPERDGTPITLEHLATHTSGLPRSPMSNVVGSLDMLRGRDPYARLGPDGLLERLPGMRLRRTPGTGRLSYSNVGAGLLGEAMARAAGTAYDDLLRERVCGPLGLADTVSRRQADAEQQGRTALGHRSRGRPAPPWPLEGMMGAGALLSTATDLLALVRVQLHPTGSPLEEAVRLTQRPRPGLDPGIGLGWMRSEPRLGLWHNGGTAGFRSFVGFGPEQDVAVVLLANQSRMLDVLGLRLFTRLTG